MSTRAERADRLRTAAEQLRARTSLADVARLLGGVSVGAVRNLLGGSTPQEKVLTKMEAAAVANGTLNGDGGDQAAIGDGEITVRDFIAAVRQQVGKRDDELYEVRKRRAHDAISNYIAALQKVGLPTDELDRALVRLERDELI